MISCIDMDTTIQFIERCDAFWKLYDQFTVIFEEKRDPKYDEVRTAVRAMDEHVEKCTVCTHCPSFGKDSLHE
jgi:hypothetical protein